MNIKIRNMKDKTEINGLIYCIGENGIFTGIFVEKEYNTGYEIIESYSNGKITKKLEYQKIITNKGSYKMSLVKSKVYRKGELFQTKNYKYNNYEILKESISEEKTVQDNNQNKTDNSKNQDSKKIQQKESERLKIDKNKDVESQFKLNTPNKGKESENTSSSSGK